MPSILDRHYIRPSLVIFSSLQPIKNPSNPNQWTFPVGSTQLYLTDDNRSPLQVNTERIEYRKRMINGKMRSYHVSDKKSFSTSWTDVPSRKVNGSSNITSDGFNAGIDIKNWYENHTGDFWVLFVYDSDNTTSGLNVKDSAELYNVFFESFDYSVSKRGNLHDFWDINLSLVEV